MTERGPAEFVWPPITLRLPDWVGEETGPPGGCFPTVEDRMDLAIRLAERSVEEDAGAPFGACVFEIESGALVTPGVSLVVRQNCSPAHGETLAIMGAQQAIGTFDLAANRFPPLELVTSAQPCIQCFGNVWWSGLKRVVMAASADDVERLT
ncbi:MAG: nucleoside deaminase, partial [Pirellulaceae bacterium]